MLRKNNLRLNLKKKIYSILIVTTFTVGFLSIMFTNSNIISITGDNNSINDISSPKTSYYNLTMDRIFINGSETGVGARNWTWAATQDWCTNNSGHLYIENLTINGGGSQSCIEIVNSNNVNFTIKNCTLYNSGSSSLDAGIKLVDTVGGKITENNISFNNNGITLLNNNTGNLITYNTIANNTLYGLIILNDTATSKGYGNCIYRNNFTGNTKHALDNCSEGLYTNSWYDIFSRPGLRAPGNYWDNYTELGVGAVDADDDGIGDMGYAIPGSGEAEDLYPIWEDGYDGSPIEIDDMAANTHVTWEWASTLSWCSGSGTDADPYTIDDLDIDAKKSTINVDGIKIQNSMVNYKITNCTVYNTSSAGIKLYNVTLGQVLENNCSDSNDIGIYLVNCFNLTISNNSLFNNSGIGLNIESSNNITINNNNATYNQGGIFVYGSNNTIINNDASNNYYGITLSYGINNIVRNCVVNNNIGYGIQLSDSNNNSIENNTLIFNQIGIYVDDGDYNDILNNTVNNNTYYGINLYESCLNEISRNTNLYNIIHGIYLSTDSNNNTIDSNNASLNGDGISLSDSDYNTLLNNTSNNNTRYGIYLETSDYNNVSGNNVIGNEVWCIYQYNCIVGSNYFEFNGNCTVQTVNDETPKPPPPPPPTLPPPFIPGYDLLLLLGTACLITTIIIWKRRKL